MGTVLYHENYKGANPYNLSGRHLLSKQTFYWNYFISNSNTGELGYDRLNGTRKIGPSYAKSVVYIILHMSNT